MGLLEGDDSVGKIEILALGEIFWDCVVYSSLTRRGERFLDGVWEVEYERKTCFERAIFGGGHHGRLLVVGLAFVAGNSDHRKRGKSRICREFNHRENGGNRDLVEDGTLWRDSFFGDMEHGLLARSERIFGSRSTAVRKPDPI